MPNVLVAGSNDYIDQQPCPEQLAETIGSCVTNPTRPNTGVSGVYFSFDSGHNRIQPEYTGWTRRDCPPTSVCAGHPGPIGTLPWYYENGLVSFGDPAVAFGPIPDANGHFSWDNGSRVYYANLTANFGAVLQPVQQGLFKGILGVAVKRRRWSADPPTAATHGVSRTTRHSLMIARCTRRRRSHPTEAGCTSFIKTQPHPGAART
jgi:hypothetical protein